MVTRVTKCQTFSRTKAKALSAESKFPQRKRSFKNRHDLTAEQVATIYKLRWRIETFFKWWKQHLKVYHLIARSEYGLMVQILGGLITYLLMTIYCRKQFNENVSIKRIRELRTIILNELFGSHHRQSDDKTIFKEQKKLTCKNLTGHY